MSYIGSTKIGKIYLGDTEIAKAYLGNELVFQKEGSPVPTFVDYIETDGTAYIDTGIIGIDPRSVEIKCIVKQNSDHILSSSTGSTENASNYALLLTNGGGLAMFAHYYFYSSGLPSLQNSITNGIPFIARVAMSGSSQSVSVKFDGESSYTTVTKADRNVIRSTRTMFLFGANTGSTPRHAAQGTRVYYCKIYSNNNFTTLVRDLVPCIYQGQYGMWDNVSNAFFGNSASSGAFSGPSNS